VYVVRQTNNGAVLDARCESSPSLQALADAFERAAVPTANPSVLYRVHVPPPPSTDPSAPLPAAVIRAAWCQSVYVAGPVARDAGLRVEAALSAMWDRALPQPFIHVRIVANVDYVHDGYVVYD
jgi:hypothetical protein